MKIEFDRKANAAYIKISSKKIKKTVTVTDECMVDLDCENNVIGIELLSISSLDDDFCLWFDLAGAADYLDKAPVTIRRWVREGRLPYHKPGKEYLFQKKDLDCFIHKSRMAGKY
mgnify:CR=1 FL=1